MLTPIYDGADVGRSGFMKIESGATLCRLGHERFSLGE